MVLLYFINFLERTNVAFAALTMNSDLGFTPEVYGFGAGLFIKFKNSSCGVVLAGGLQPHRGFVAPLPALPALP